VSDVSRAFANYALSQSEFPDAAIIAAKTFMLDSLGVGIAGSKADRCIFLGRRRGRFSMG